MIIQCEWFNHTLLNLLKTLPKEQKSDWPSHAPSLGCTYNAMPNSITGYQPYELMFGCKASTMCDAWLGLANYDGGQPWSKSSYINKQYELIMSVNQHALKHIKQMAKQSVARAGGKPLQIPVGNLVLLRDHPEGWNKIQDNYKSELFVMESQHQDPNVYTIKPDSHKGVVQKVNWHELFNLKRSLGNPNSTVSVPNINVPKYPPKKKLTQTPPISHPYGTCSKTKAAATLTSTSMVSHDDLAGNHFISLVSGFAKAAMQKFRGPFHYSSTVHKV